MSIGVQIYSNANSTSTNIDVDFIGGVLVESYGSPTAGTFEYYFKISTSSRTDNNGGIPVHVMKDLSTLALNGVKQSASNTGVAYSDINSMVVDYVYDTINGHTANQFLSGCSLQRPMKFS